MKICFCTYVNLDLLDTLTGQLDVGGGCRREEKRNGGKKRQLEKEKVRKRRVERERKGEGGEEEGVRQRDGESTVLLE